MKKLFKFLKDEEGISSVEYALLLAFIAALLISAITGLSTAVSNQFTAITALI